MKWRSQSTSIHFPTYLASIPFDNDENRCWSRCLALSCAKIGPIAMHSMQHMVQSGASNWLVRCRCSHRFGSSHDCLSIGLAQFRRRSAMSRTHYPWAQTKSLMTANRPPVVWRWFQLFQIWMRMSRLYEREHFVSDLISMMLNQYAHIRKMMDLCNWRTENKKFRIGEKLEIHIHISCWTAMNVQMAWA